MNISLAPSFHCNFRCSWCYLSVDQLRDKTLLDLGVLKNKLDQAGAIDQIDIYGGEAATLPVNYVTDLLVLLKNYTSNINVISNFSLVPEWFHRDDITLSASYDWVFRQQHEKVLNNIIGFSKSVPILMLATEDLCKVDPKEIADILNTIRTVKSLEIKPYSTNQFNQHGMNWTVFEDWIKKWLSLELNFELVNHSLIDNSIKKVYNAYSDNHLYIGPDGEFSVLDFDLNNREYFRKIANLPEYHKWVEKEKQMIERNKFCKECEWRGHCLTEHYRNVESLEYSCNGFKNLLNWYARLEN
jgi:sulfatase maturation enzyme AslB (radical SAM superfamily)